MGYADLFRRGSFSYGDRPVLYAVDSATLLYKGDAVWVNTDDIRPANDNDVSGYGFTWDTDLATTAAQFRTRFAGIALATSLVGKTDEVPVGTAGIYEFACAAATFEVGDFVSLDDNATPDQLENQKVIATTDPRQAIGRVVKRYSSNTTTVLVEIFPVASGNGGGIPKVETIPIASPNVTNAANCVTSFTFGRRMMVIGWETFVCETLSNNLTTLTFEKDTVDLTETLAIAASAAIGDRDYAAVTTAGEGLFEADSVLDVESDGACTTGVVSIHAIAYEVGEAT